MKRLIAILTAFIIVTLSACSPVGIGAPEETYPITTKGTEEALREFITTTAPYTSEEIVTTPEPPVSEESTDVENTDTTTEESVTESEVTTAATTKATTAATTKATTAATTKATTAATTKATTTTTAEVTVGTEETTTEAVTEPAIPSETTGDGEEEPPEFVIPTEVGAHTAINFDVQKAVWVSFYEMESLIKGKTVEEYCNAADAMCDNLVALGANTVYLHVRAHGDAFYQSSIYPWAKECSGTLGTDPGYDPLRIFLAIAHGKGLSVHAWINPLRLMKESEMELLPYESAIRQLYESGNGTKVVSVNGYWYLNPAYSETRDIVCMGAREIVSGYNVDGIHIDDYFYPTTDAFFDYSAFYDSGADDLSNWRIGNINALVKGMYSTVKSTKSSVLFGISPAGIIDNCYKKCYADVETWCSQTGYCDYIVPQIYFGFDNQNAPFRVCVDSWLKINTESRVKIVAGLAFYKAGTEDSNAGGGSGEWVRNSDIIARQIEYFMSERGTDGVALFRYDSIFNNNSKTAAKEKQNAEAVLQNQ